MSLEFFMDYLEEDKIYIDGIACPYICHLQAPLESGPVYPAHFHYYIEMLYALSGDFQIYLNGSYHKFASGDFVLINSREVHRIDALSKDGGNYIVVRFLPELIYDGMNQSHFEYRYLLPFISDDNRFRKIFSKDLLAETQSVIPQLMKDLWTEARTVPYGHELAIRHHIEGIYLWLLRYWHANVSDDTASDLKEEQLRNILLPALTYMTEHYENPLSASEMANLCHLSYSYFSRNFNRLMKMSFNDYLNHIRIREAEKLLISTTFSVTEIASSVGFCTTSYFIKQFKDHLQISPKQYRKNYLTKTVAPHPSAIYNR